jgi:glycosyltransferase EpsH
MDFMTPKISIIVIAYNTQDYLPKCLDSILAQTLSNIEVIIIDDASDYDLTDIVCQYKEKDARITFSRLPENRGPGGARNAALSEAKGEFIAFVDSDDWIDLNFCEKLLTSIETHCADIAVCGIVREYENNPIERIYKCKYQQEYLLDGITTFRIMTGEYEMGIKFNPSALNKLYRKSFLTENCALFPEYAFFEDQLFSYQTTLSAKKVVCVPDTEYHYFRRCGSIVQSFTQKNIDDMINAYTNIRSYLKEKGLYAQYVKNYYLSLSHFYGLIVRQIFEFVDDEQRKKEYLKESFKKIMPLIDFQEYFNISSADKLRRHIFPDMADISIQ